MTYKKHKLTPYRRLVWDLLKQSDRFYLNHHMVLADLSRLNDHREACRQRGIAVPTYVAFVLAAIGRVIRDHPIFNSYLRTFPPKRLIIYQNIDITFTVEKQCGDEAMVILGKVRDADRRSLEEISEIIQQYGERNCEDLEEFKTLNQFYSRLPALFRRLFFELLVKPFPERVRRVGGTVAFTSVGKLGVSFTAPLSMRSALFSLGEIAERPLCRQGNVVARPTAYLTLTYDHRIADGATAARLLNDLKCYLEDFPS